MNNMTSNAPLDGGRSASADMGIASSIATSWITPRFIEWNDVSVVFNKSQLLKDYVQLFVSAYSVHFPGLLTEEEFERYLCTLLSMRIRLVTRLKYPFDPKMHKIFIPAFWADYLSQVGVVEDASLGVKLAPVIGDDIVESELPEFEFRVITEKLLKAQASFKYGNEMPRSTKGNFDFMTMQRVNGELASHQSDVHASIAFMSGFMEQKMVEQIFFPLVSYGSVESVRHLVGGLL